MLDRRRLETRSLYRSVRYRVGREEQPRTADPSAWTFRIRKSGAMDSTLTQTIDSANMTRLQSVQTKQYEKNEHFRSLNSVMERREKRPSRDRSISNCEEYRIVLPAFDLGQKEVEDSDFSLLTPFNKPYTNAKLCLMNCQNELKNQRILCEEVKYGLQHLKLLTQKQLTQIEQTSTHTLAQLRNILRKDYISHQQKKMKNKRQMEELFAGHDENVQLFEKLDGHSSDLQIGIFNSTPFNLIVDGNEEEQVYI